MRNKKIKPKVGDIFKVPISGSTYGVGQILAAYKNEMFLMVIFSYKVSNNMGIDLLEATNSEPLFISNSLDAKIWHGHWPIIGNMPPNFERLPLPKYLIKIGDEIHIEDYHAQNRRISTDSEQRNLSFRICVAPVRLEKALKAYWGIDQWNENYEVLKASYSLEAAKTKL